MSQAHDYKRDVGHIFPVGPPHPREELGSLSQSIKTYSELQETICQYSQARL